MRGSSVFGPPGVGSSLMEAGRDAGGFSPGGDPRWWLTRSSRFRSAEADSPPGGREAFHLVEERLRAPPSSGATRADPDPSRRQERVRVTPRHVNRRAFLTVTASSTLGLAVAGSAPAAAADGLTVYRLNADWGYPVGPKGKTRCGCRSCHRRAASGYFRTEAAAIAGRVHPCCVCQPYAVTLTDVSGDDLFGDGDSADLRDPRVAAVFDRIESTRDALGDPTRPVGHCDAPGHRGAFATARRRRRRARGGRRSPARATPTSFG